MHRIAVVTVVVLLSLVAAGAAQAAPAFDKAFTLSGAPQRLATGPDGNVWFTEDVSGGNAFGKIAPNGTVTEYPLPQGVQNAGVTSLLGITTGPDHNLWATAVNNVVRIDPSNPAGAKAFNDTDIGTPQDITTGPDANLWTGSDANVIRIAPTATPKFKTFPGLVQSARGIAAGGDGNIWVDDFTGGAVVRIDTSGSLVKTIATGGGPQGITAGPTGQLAYTNPTGSPQEIGRLDYNNNVQKMQFQVARDPFGVVFANDGAYWIAEFAKDQLGRLTPGGQFTEPVQLPAGSGPRRIVRGAGDTLWVGLETSKQIARITGVSAPASSPPGGSTGPGTIVPAQQPVFPGVQLHLVVLRLHGKTVVIRVPCPAGFGGGCAGTIALQTAAPVRTPKLSAATKKKKRRRRLRLGSASFSIPAGQTGNVKVKLSKSALKLLAKAGSLKVLATLTVTAGATTRTTTATFTLKPAKKKRRRR